MTHWMQTLSGKWRDFPRKMKIPYRDAMVTTGRNAFAPVLLMGTGNSKGILGITLLKRWLVDCATCYHHINLILIEGCCLLCLGSWTQWHRNKITCSNSDHIVFNEISVSFFFFLIQGIPKFWWASWNMKRRVNNGSCSFSLGYILNSLKTDNPLLLNRILYYLEFP